MNSNYYKRYSDYCITRQSRTLPESVYYEKHHILPRSLGGSDRKSNLVALLPEEHIEAHILLADAMPCRATWNAASGTINRLTTPSGFCSSGKVATSLELKEVATRYASLARLGDNNPNYGGNFSEQHRRKISENHSKPWLNETILRFKHKDGREFIGTAYDLRNKFNLDKGNLSKVINGHQLTTKGWSLV